MERPGPITVPTLARPFAHDWPRNKAERQALDQWAINNVARVVEESVRTINDELLSAGMNPETARAMTSRIKDRVLSVWAGRVLNAGLDTREGADRYLEREFGVTPQRRRCIPF